MQKLSAMIVAMVILVATAIPAAALETSGDAYVGVYNKYLWRGFDLSPDADFVVQPGADLCFGKFTVSYWANYDEALETVNEVDIVLDYSTEVNELISVSVGNIYYALEGIEDTSELYGGVEFNTLLSPTLTLFWDYDEAEETGLFAVLAVSHDFDLVEKLTLGLGALVSLNLESDYAVGDYSGLHSGELSAALEYAVNDLVTVGATAIFSTPLSDDAEDIAGIDDEVLAGINVTLAF